MGKKRRIISFLLCLCLSVSILMGTNATLVKAEIGENEVEVNENNEEVAVTPEEVVLEPESALAVSLANNTGDEIKVYYRTKATAEAAFSDWALATSSLSIDSDIVDFEIVLAINSGTTKNYRVGIYDSGSPEGNNSIIASNTYYATAPGNGNPGTSILSLFNGRLNAGGAHNFQIQLENAGGQNPTPAGNGMSGDFKVTIGSIVIFDNSKNPGPKTAGEYTDKNGKQYKVELDSRGEGIVIKPVEGTDTLAAERPDADLQEREANGSKIVLEAITTSGNGKVDVQTGLNYTPSGMEGRHIEEAVPVIIEKAGSGGANEGYSFYASDGKAEFSISGGNRISRAQLEGGIKASRFDIGDNSRLDIGFNDNKATVAFDIPGQVNISKAETNIFANTAFKGSSNIVAQDEAKIKVDGATTVFDNCSKIIVRYGGSFVLDATSPIAMPSNIKAGYLTELGQIRDFTRVTDYRDEVIEVSCTPGNHENDAGRYIYEISGNHVELTSTTGAIYSLAYYFDDSKDPNFVENGDFKIEAASGLHDLTVQNGGEYFFEAGTEVKFTLLPNAGFKYKEGSFSFNDRSEEDSVTATEAPGVYTITMPNTSIHVSCKFEEASNDVLTDGSTAVVGAEIRVPDGVVSNGTATFEALDATLDSTQEAAFNSAATTGYTVSKALDLSLNQEIDKIGTNEKWVTPITELSSPMSITMTLDDALLGASDIEIIRQHNGKTEALPTTYDASTNQITFETNGFSTYAIATKGSTSGPSKEQVDSFVSRMYTTALNRDKDEVGAEYWAKQLMEGTIDAAGIAKGFIESKEFTEKKLSDEEYVETLYQTFLGRAADADGKAYWVKLLKEGRSRNSVLSGFVNSAEFTGICDESGIARGTMDDDGSCVYNKGVRDFVLRNYSTILNRKGETMGVEHWSYLINKKQLTPEECVVSIVHSEEFVTKKLSDEEYVETLYEAALGRPSDKDGKVYWVAQLKAGRSRDEILAGFTKSAEFSGIVKSFGIN